MYAAVRAMLALSLSVLLAATALLNCVPRSSAASLSDDATLYQALLDLTNPWTVMCVAAHPDDEDGATLTLLRRKYGVHTVTLFSTYGEGGQNATGPELYEELGAIRARETMEAAEIQGSEAYFLGLRDFGFSKSADEAFRVWGHDEALKRMVLQIRRLRPDVIITNHDTVSGHGHHQATGRLVLEAFDAAADPARFPEQLRNGDGLGTWQAQRLFVRTFSEGGTATKQAEGEAGGLVSIDVNERDTTWGSTYAQQALRALQRHATQGPWPQTVPASGWPLIRYHLARMAKDAAPLPRNAQSLLEGMLLSPSVAERLTPLAVKSFMALYASSRDQREELLQALVTARKGGLFTAPAAQVSEAPRFRLMAARLDHALAVASGISINFEPRDEPLIPGAPIAFNIDIQDRGIAGVTVKSLSFSGGGQGATPALKEPVELTPGKSFVAKAEYTHAKGLAINVPHAAHLYDGRVFGEQFSAEAVVNLGGTEFPIASKTAFDVAPAVEIKSITPSPLVLTPATVNQGVSLTFQLVNHENATFKGSIRSHDLMHTMEAGPWFGLAAHQAGELKRTFAFPSVRERSDKRSRTPLLPSAVKFSILRGGDKNPVTEQTIGVAYSDARVPPHLRVGYVRSFDDTLRDALAALGVEARELTVTDVRSGDLKDYDTIIIDNRGYQAHPELVAANSRLLEYVNAGGTLIVFYHKTNEWNPDPQKGRPQLAPYPIIVGNDRVTDENATVTFAEPEHALLNFPNKITPEDFKGWIQERGLYYPKQWDEHYSAPLVSSDAGEQPLRGGLLAADYGRGHYIYTSMVWYRQLRAGVPGAYRMFANMLSYGRLRNAEIPNAECGMQIYASESSNLKSEIYDLKSFNPQSAFRN